MNSTLIVIAASLLAAGCAGAPPANPAGRTAAPPASADQPRIVRSRDGSFDGEVTGSPVPGSAFEKIQIGMSADEVVWLMGRPPDRYHLYETGKRWIPFYYGNDAVRMQMLFGGAGCLIYATGNRFNLTNPDLIRIEHDPSGRCYQP